MSYITYKLIHFLGIFVMLTVLAAVGMHGIRGGTRDDMPYRKQLGLAHAISGLLILVGGFGMLARLGIVQGGLPVWVYLKLAIWLVLGAALAVPYRGRGPARATLILVPLLALLAGATALYKPF